MNLPLRIVDTPTTERLLSVDGAWGAAGLNLSHWPGNATPAELRHDLSTGIALNFARLPARERERLAAGCVAIANNHYDTEGVCAVFAVRHPDLALPRERVLLETGAAGDLFQLPSEKAFCLDAAITNLADADRSPWSARFRGLSDREKHEMLLVELVERLPALLDGDLADLSGLWKPELEALRADLADLASAAQDEVVHLDLCVWTAGPGARSTRAREESPFFDPGRHALLGSTRADRALVLGTGDGGTTCRLLLSTLSWFDLVTRRTLPRPDLATLAARLDGIEGVDPAGPCAWRFQDSASPAPELWFGTENPECFGEHNPALRSSRLEPAVVRRAVADALRASWRFPE